MTMSARAVAFAAVRRVVEEGGYSTIVVPNALARSSLDVRDRAFAADLAYGTIRRLRSLDWAIERRSTRPVARMSPIARDVLRLGAYQLLFTGAAPHAAVGETVSLAAPKERGFVNAVLRKLASDPPAWPAGAGDADVAVRTGMQPWAVMELRRLVGEEAVRRSTPRACSSTAATLRRSPGSGRDGSRSRTRHRPSWSARSTRGPANGSSTRARRPVGRPTTPRGSWARTASWWRPISTPSARG